MYSHCLVNTFTKIKTSLKAQEFAIFRCSTMYENAPPPTRDIYLLVLNCNIIAFEITMVNAQLLVPSTLQNIHLFGYVTDNQVPTQNMYELQAIK